MPYGASHYVGRASLCGFVLQPSSVQTASGTGAAVGGFGEFGTFVFQMDVTATATAAGDLLDAYVQGTIDGTNWFDMLHFTQVLGNGGALRYYGKVVPAYLTQTAFNSGSMLGAGSSAHLLSDQLRARWAITSASAPSFTFSIALNALS